LSHSIVQIENGKKKTEGGRGKGEQRPARQERKKGGKSIMGLINLAIQTIQDKNIQHPGGARRGYI